MRDLGKPVKPDAHDTVRVEPEKYQMRHVQTGYAMLKSAKIGKSGRILLVMDNPRILNTIRPNSLMHFKTLKTLAGGLYCMSKPNPPHMLPLIIPT